MARRSNMRGAIDVSQLASQVAAVLAEYNDVTLEELEAIKESVAERCARRLSEVSPKKYGDYRRGWRKKKVNSAWIVHNATDYQLTHLLEKGHANIAVGRPTPAYPHIRPVELEIIAQFEAEIRATLGG
jgi:hypothetical protein